MPNWTTNHITIEGPAEEITRLRENFCDEGGFGGYGFNFEPQVVENENGTPA